MPEFISVTFPNASTELNPIPDAGIDRDYLIRYARNFSAMPVSRTISGSCVARGNLPNRSTGTVNFSHSNNSVIKYAQ